MELQLFTIIFTSLLFLLIVVKLNINTKSKGQNPSLPLPPGPFKLPLIGHLHHLVGDLPHRSLKHLAKIHGPLMYLKLGELSSVIISSATVAKQMMKTHDLMFVERPVNLAGKILSYERRDLIMAPYGEFWKRIRKICINELLTPKRVESFWSIREEEVLDLIGRISLMAGSPMNLTHKLFTLTVDIMARSAFGKKCKDKQAFILIITEATRLVSGFQIADLFPSQKLIQVLTGTKQILESLHQQLDELLDDIIKEHRANRINNIQDKEYQEDLVDVLLRLHEDKEQQLPITIENVKAVTFDMFAAGTDTSSTAVEWAFSELLRNPRIMEKVQAEVRQAFKGKKKIDQADVNELTYLRLVVKETLRLHPPLPLLVARECRDNCEIVEGYEIPKGCKVIVNAWAIGRDPQHWTNPESFEPERFQDLNVDFKGNNFDFIPFGAGRRMCPGALLAIANVELPLALLLYHFDWKLANGIKPEELDMIGANSAVVKRQNDLYVIPTPYNT